jgi:hypothetical protein
MTRARDVADTQDNLGGAVAPFVAAKNKIINGDFAINQRSFSSQAVTAEQKNYTFDRFYFLNIVSGTTTCSAQTFTAGTAPVAGYEGTNFIRLASTGQSNGFSGSFIAQSIEDVRTLSGQTVTVSFWAKANSGTPKVAIELRQNFGAGGSTAVEIADSVTTSTAWTRYTKTFNVASVAGKTIGANSTLELNLWTSAGVLFASRTASIGIQTTTIDFWGIQVEAGSVATPFTTASGTIGGELALCQRYYYRVNNDANGNAFFFGNGIGFNSTNVSYNVQVPVTMRVGPTSVDFPANLATSDTTNTAIITSLSINQTNPQNVIVFATVASGITQFRPYFLFSNGSAGTKFIGLSAEL